MKVALIPCGRCDWQEQDRLLGRAELALNETGRRQCQEWAARLRDLEPALVLHAPDGLATETAKILARQLVVPAKALAGLAEVDIGLWAGLTEAQLKTRYASAYRLLCEAPLNVQPPGGEALSAAGQRLDQCLRKQLRKSNGKAALGVVLRPLAWALLRCALEGRPPVSVLEEARGAAGPLVLALGVATGVATDR